MQGVYTDLSNEEYHGHAGTFSSSQLKDLLEDPEVFYRKYIIKTEERISIPAFDVGTYFHTAILEPEKLKIECAVYGSIRRGKDWEAFKAANENKTIITQAELEQADGIIKAVKSSPIAMGRISRGKPEVSAFVTLIVSGQDIFSSDGKRTLGKYGWEKANAKMGKSKVEIPLKVRADLLAPDFILDLKSTTGNVRNDGLMKKKVSDYSYDLSAALYLDLFSLALDRTLSEFVWVFASKDLFNCKSYIASDRNIQVGRAKYRKALLTLADCIASDWAFEDSMGILEPSAWEAEILKPTGEELL